MANIKGFFVSLWDDPKKRKITVVVLIAVIACVVIYFGYRTVHTLTTYKDEEQLHDVMLAYKPEQAPEDASVVELAEPVSEHDVVINQSIDDLKSLNKDVVGWIYIPDTLLDYPFVRAKDNDYYLRRNIYGKWLDTGTIFLDYRNDPDFLDYYSLIYGHHMNNGSVFGEISYYADQAFFDAHKTGYIYTPYQDFRIDFFAYLVVAGNDANVYDPSYITQADNVKHIAYFQDNARTSEQVAVKALDRLVVLSTCSYEFNDARSILVGRLVPVRINYGGSQ